MADLHGWQADPFGVHEQRYYSQGQPTKLVRNQGQESYDDPPGGAPATPDPQPPVTPPPGWWLASDGNWYPPELAPDAQPEPAPVAPVVAAAPVSEPVAVAPPAQDPATPPPGWWLASDGNWYPPELAPDAQPEPAPVAPVVAAAPVSEPVAVAPPAQDPATPPPGWWLASDGNWYPPELAPDAQPEPAPVAPVVAAAPVSEPVAVAPPAQDPATPPPGWWLASDGNWYPPELAPDAQPEPAPVAPVVAAAPVSEPVAVAPPAQDPATPPPGWWLASDGNWYPPELAPDAQPEPAPVAPVVAAAPVSEPVAVAPPAQDPATPPPGWWLASDGNWYPPELAPDAQPEPAPVAPVVAAAPVSEPVAVAPPAQDPATPPPGWWLASDGNWYPPELAPDAQPEPAPVAPVVAAAPVSEPVAVAPPAQDPATPPPGWWLASDGNWYPPELAPGATTSVIAQPEPAVAHDLDVAYHGNGTYGANGGNAAAPPPGWWLASDGNWYPPELAPGERPA